MPNARHFMTGGFNAADIPSDGLLLTVRGAGEKDFKDDEGVKLILFFEETGQYLSLNKTNLGTMLELGDDTDTWIGKQIRVIKVKTQFAGKEVDGIRIQL